MGGASALSEADGDYYHHLKLKMLARIDTLKAEVLGMQKGDFDAEEQLMSEFQKRSVRAKSYDG